MRQTGKVGYILTIPGKIQVPLKLSENILYFPFSVLFDSSDVENSYEYLN